MAIHLNQIAIKSRLYAGFGVLVVLGIMVAGYGAWQLSNTRAQITQMNAVSANTVRVLEETRLIETIRRARRAYGESGDAGVAKEMKDAVAQALGLLKESGANTISQERLAIYNSSSTGVADQGTQFDQMVQLKTQEATALANLFTGGDTMTAATDKLVAAVRDGKDSESISAALNVERAILLVRIANWRFLATHDPKGPATFAINADKAKTALSAMDKVASETLRPLGSAVTAALVDYTANFITVSTTSLKRNQIDAKMSAQADDIQTQLGKAQATLVSDFAAAETNMQSDIASTMWWQILLAALATLFGSVTAFLIARSIALPLTAMTGTMGSLAKGDLTVEIPATENKDEIGDMAKAVQIFKDSMVETARLRTEQEEQKKRAAAERHKLMLELAAKFETNVGGVVKTVASAATELQATAQSMAATAEETSRQSNAVAAASEQASANVQTVSSATEELSASIKEITQQVGESTRIVGDSAKQASETNIRVQHLKESVQKIDTVVNLINDIASQTNLLALNATIEAARAGEMGKGFAVVASEVKALATQTAKATEEIAAQIRGIQEETDLSVQAIEAITQTIGQVSTIATSIAAAVEEQGSATQEIARSVAQAAQGTNEVSSNIVSVSEGSKQTGAAATQMLSAAQELSMNGETLKTQVESFLKEVRAA